MSEPTIYANLDAERQRNVIEQFLSMNKKQRREAKHVFMAGLLRDPNDRRPRRVIMADAQRVWDRVRGDIKHEAKRKGVAL